MRGMAIVALIAAMCCGVATAAEPAYERLQVELETLPAQCRVPSELVSDPSLLRRSARRVEREQVFRIVVLGTATAQGVGASMREKSWPSRLEAELRKRFPGIRLGVVVKARAYDTARQMIDRLDEVLLERPHLVIWETGTAEAVRSVDVDEFIASLRDGIDRIAATRADIVLVEPQYAHRTAMLINYAPYLDAISQAEGMRDLIVFRRYAIMKHWARSGQIVVDNLPLSMMAATADVIYECIGRLLDIQIGYGMRHAP